MSTGSKSNQPHKTTAAPTAPHKGDGSRPTATATHTGQKPGGEGPKGDVSGKPSSTPPSAAGATTSSGSQSTGDAGGKGSKTKRQRIRLVSTSNPKFWVRMFKDVYDAQGCPRDPKGEPMVVRAGVSFGATPEERAKAKAERDAAKAAEKAKVEAMSPEEKTAYLRQKREAKNAKKEQRSSAERAAFEHKLRVQTLLDLRSKGIDITTIVSEMEKAGQDVSALRTA